jgi:cytochrome c-type biogenesis protein CcmE
MKAKQKKFVIGGIIILLTLVYVVYAGVRDSMVYYFTPTELLAKLANGDVAINEGVRVSGRVEEGSIKHQQKDMVLTFTLTDQKNSIPVYYKGVVPDTFKYGVEVVVEGKLNSEKTFKATTLLAKCPSKYESES